MLAAAPVWGKDIELLNCSLSSREAQMASSEKGAWEEDTQEQRGKLGIHHLAQICVPLTKGNLY